MRIVVHGQQAFGKAVLEALLKRGGECGWRSMWRPRSPGKSPIRSWRRRWLPIFRSTSPASYRKAEVWEEFRALKPDLQVMAFVTLFVPEEFLNIPTHGLDTVSPVAAAGLSRRERDQLADHPG